MTLYLQGVLELSPLEAGLRFLPLTLLSFIVAPLSAKFSDRIPARASMGTGLILVGVGLILMGGISVEDGWTALLPGFVLAGIGIGMTNPGIASTALAVVDASRAGMASGINSTFRQVGIATGVATLGVIFQARVESKLDELVPQAPDAFADAITAGAIQSAVERVPPEFQTRAADAASQAFISGLNTILVVGAAIAILGGIASWLLVDPADFVAPQGAAEPDVPAAG
jgi:MFS family permease